MNPNAIRPWVPSASLREHIEKLAFDLRLSAEARQYIETTLTSGPSRRVQGRAGNVITKFFSAKMNTSHLLESRTGEFPMAVQFESNEEVLAYFAQPPQVFLPVYDDQGRTTTTLGYTPDFLTIERTRIAVVETRDEAALLKRAVKNPHQFYQDETGGWHYRAAEQHFKALGIDYILIPNSAQPAVLVENSRFLEDYLREDCPPLDDAQAEALRTYVETHRHVSLPGLLQHGFVADDIYKAIAAREVFVDLTSTRLAVTEEVTVFSDETTQKAHALVALAAKQPPLPIPGSMHLRPGTRIKVDGADWVVRIVGQRDVIVEDEQRQSQSFPVETLWKAQVTQVISADGVAAAPDQRRIDQCSKEELEDAMRRLDAMRAANQDQFSSRSLSRFASKTAFAANDLEMLMALVDRKRDRGNREPKLSPKNLELIESSVKEHYNNPTQRRKKAVYLVYTGACADAKEANGQPVKAASYATFCRYCDRLRDVKARYGRRAAYQQSEIVAGIENAFPVHGVRPHDVCYVDHTIANLATVSPNGVQLGKPTLTIAVDGHTANPRALILSYDPPSTRTVLLVLRDYVRRHQRLPRVLVVDNGKEFHSKELEDFCKIYGIDLRYRSPGMPRGGAMVERLLGASEEEVISEMQGNTRMLKKDARLVTKSVNPFNQATWTLCAAYRALDEYLFKVRPKRIHPALGITPEEFEQKRTEETGVREHRMFRLDENFMLMTSPHARRPFHKVNRTRGVWVDGLWYSHPALKEVRRNEKVEVRVEPWNASVIYVLVKGRWHAAIGNASRWLVDRTRREMEVVLREEARKSKVDANRATLTPAQKQDRPRTWTPEMFDPRLAEQQREARHLFEELGMGAAMPTPTGERADEGGTSGSTKPFLDSAKHDQPAPEAKIPAPAMPVETTVQGTPSVPAANDSKLVTGLLSLGYR